MPTGETPFDQQVHEIDGNRLALLTDGRLRLRLILQAIASAQAELRLLYYIYTDDAAGRQVLAALLEARRRGVAVSLIVDGFGSGADAAFFRPLTDAGASVCRFEPRWGRRYLLRNHQKLLLADRRLAIIGGFNIEDDYFGRGDSWRDLGLSIEGPAADDLAGYFDGLAAWIDTPNARMRDLRALLKEWSGHGGRICWLLGGPTRRLSPWARTIRRELKTARRLDMIAAYFTPNPAMLRAIERVALSGGAARVMTAARSDNTATIAAARHTYARLLRRGVRLFEYRPRKLHTKLYVVDDAVHIGSANFDIRSLYLNLEMMVRVEDAGFAAAVRTYVEGEIADAREVTREDHARAGLWQRVRWGAAYFVVGVLDGNITRRLNFGIDGR